MSRHIPRIYCPDCNGEIFVVPEYQKNHMINVLRMREGAQFLAFNEMKGEWLCEVREIQRASISIGMIYQTREFSAADRAPPDLRWCRGPLRWRLPGCPGLRDRRRTCGSGSGESSCPPCPGPSCPLPSGPGPYWPPSP